MEYLENRHTMLLHTHLYYDLSHNAGVNAYYLCMTFEQLTISQTSRNIVYIKLRDRKSLLTKQYLTIKQHSLIILAMIAAIDEQFS